MDTLFEYIDRTGVPNDTKWMLLRMSMSRETMFTKGDLEEMTGHEQRVVTQHLVRLIKQRIVSWRAHPEEQHVILYWITDHHLRHRIAAMKNAPHFSRN